jgi:hypothetical protein
VAPGRRGNSCPSSASGYAASTASCVTLQDSHAHGGTFSASNSFDAGDNLFWNFVASATTAVYFDSSYQ